ncbi:hypothetical protein [Neptuniibacter marinus]|uniref:hypothetical protein n=1 Tax=Neptuniibacter marinus TaxID=1806670 RepID=UPI003B59468C
MQFSTARQAESETQHLGKALAQQSDILIRPLLLSNDRVSLNYLLNELQQIPYIKGLQVADQSGVIIARSGEANDIKLQQRLIQQEKIIATVTLWLTPEPLKQALRSQFWPLLFLACAIALLSLLVIWYFGHYPTTDEQEEQTPDDPAPDRLSGLTFSESLAIQNEGRHSDISAIEDSSLSNKETFISTNSDTESAVDEIDTTPQTTTNDHPLRETETDFQNDATQDDQLHTESLVDLLKPEHSNAPQMPKFEHHPQDLEHAEATASPDEFSIEEELIDEKQDNTDESPTKTKNPLFKEAMSDEMRERKEVQLGLYSFEDELELFLAPQDAIYLFYIDSNTASSDNMHPDEKATLLNVYLHLAKQVARIYNGESEQLENNDILLRFELRDSNDSHGINALCAAILFSLLYKGFNQARIKGFQPVLSLQMSLSRGHYDKHSLVKEEAHFLTRTTNSNELISHTALTEAPLLKRALLEQADIRREDEDKVLLLKVTPKHQALLQKQANHLLTKIFKKS